MRNVRRACSHILYSYAPRAFPTKAQRRIALVGRRGLCAFVEWTYAW
jgi:hypothetical protein